MHYMLNNIVLLNIMLNNIVLLKGEYREFTCGAMAWASGIVTEARAGSWTQPKKKKGRRRCKVDRMENQHIESKKYNLK